MDVKVFCLISLVITVYIILGGLLFQFIEQKEVVSHDTEPDIEAIHKFGKELCLGKEDVNDMLQHLLGELLADGWSLNVTIRDGKNQTFNGSQTSNDLSLHISLTLPHPKDKWDLYGSIFYAETIVTTIGYGQISPTTLAGRLVTCLYAIIGIPFLLMWAGVIGDNVIEMAKRFRKRVEIKKRWHLQFLIFQITIIVAIGSGIFIFAPAALFSYMEDWTYADGIYFGVITLTTTGLGDLAAGTRDDAPAWYRVFIHFWLFIGLAWLTMIISLGVKIYRTRAKQVIKEAEVKVVKIATEIKQKFATKRLTRRKSFSGVRQISIMVSTTSSAVQIASELAPGLARLLSREGDAAVLIEHENQSDSSDSETKPLCHQTSYARRGSGVSVVSNELSKHLVPQLSRLPPIRQGSHASSPRSPLQPQPPRKLSTILETDTPPRKLSSPRKPSPPKRFSSYTTGAELVVRTSKKKPSLGLRSASVLLFDKNDLETDAAVVNNNVLEELTRETSPGIPGTVLNVVTPHGSDSSEEKEVETSSPTSPQTSFSRRSSSSSSRRRPSTLIIPPAVLMPQISRQPSSIKRGTSILDNNGNLIHSLPEETNNLVVITDNGIAECLDKEITVLRPRSKSVGDTM